MQISQKRNVHFDGEITVGNDILELLSSAMYVDPLSIFREYVQNAADAIDEASTEGLYKNKPIPEISISLDAVSRTVRIRDEGVGVPNRTFVRTLTSIGSSAKRGKTARGFRGVGRLAGLGYCQALVMRSKASSDEAVFEMRWDCKKLKELLRETVERPLKEVLAAVVSVSSTNAKGAPQHFFEVEMQGTVRHKNDLLLNEALVSRYLSEVGPVPFHSSFSFAEKINAFFEHHNVGQSFKTFVNGSELFRPHRDSYEARLNTVSKFKSVETFEIPGYSSGFEAIGWVIHGEYLGAIPERNGIHGLRLRAGNIQIGDARLLDSLFPQPRFNAWAVGECHIISPKLIPNARRDDLEHGTHRANLITHLTPKAVEILKACRTHSSIRTRERRAADQARSGNSLDWGTAKGFLQKNADKKLSATHKAQIRKKLQNGGLTYVELIMLLTQNLNADRPRAVK
jgi:hypothetical protein